jgi:hypothetical protein
MRCNADGPMVSLVATCNLPVVAWERVGKINMAGEVIIGEERNEHPWMVGKIDRLKCIR